MQKVRVGSWYVFNPVGIDLWDGKWHGRISIGDKVQVFNMHGCPPANTMGHCYVRRKEGEAFALVLCNSLISVKAICK